MCSSGAWGEPVKKFLNWWFSAWWEQKSAAVSPFIASLKTWRLGAALTQGLITRNSFQKRGVDIRGGNGLSSAELPLCVCQGSLQVTAQSLMSQSAQCEVGCLAQSCLSHAAGSTDPSHNLPFPAVAKCQQFLLL